jgi:hypothetical protein
MGIKSVLAAGVVGLAASAASAGLVVTGEYTGTFNGFDEITLKLVGFTGADDVPGNAINSIAGTFSAVGAGAVLSVPGSTSLWDDLTLNATFNLADPGVPPGRSSNPPVSKINFSGLATASGFVRTPNTSTPTSFGGISVDDGWFTNDTTALLKPGPDDDAGDPDNDNLVNEEILAIIFVKKGTDAAYGVTFTGQYNSEALPGQPQIVPAQGEGSIVVLIPEPASMSVLGLGALGLLGRRRRA